MVEASGRGFPERPCKLEREDVRRVFYTPLEPKAIPKKTIVMGWFRSFEILAGAPYMPFVHWDGFHGRLWASSLVTL